MKILAFLQNQWFKDPERIRALYARRPEHRRRFTAGFLFMSFTGRRLQQVFGDLVDSIIWENASPEIGGKSSASFKADLGHMTALISTEDPDIVLTFGKTATEAVSKIKLTKAVHIAGPHPAARQPATLAKLKEMEQRLRQTT